jgi:hypothetical protein
MRRDEFEREIEALGESRGVARRLLALELGAQSRVRGSLRARLLSAGPRRRFSAGGLLAFAAAAALLVAMLIRLPRRTEPLRPPSAAVMMPAAASQPQPPPPQVLFRSVRPAEGPSPFKTIPAGRLIETRPIRIEQLFFRPAFVRAL